jgi:hypothetical protein
MVNFNWTCPFCLKYSKLCTSAIHGRQVKGGHLKCCTPYLSINYLRFSGGPVNPEITERLQELREEGRANRDDRDEAEYGGDGYMSDDSVMWDHHIVPAIQPAPLNQDFNVNFLITQYGYMNKIDNLSNTSMSVGTVAGTILGKRRQADWEDYVIFNSLCETLHLTNEQGSEVLRSFREILLRHNVELFIPTTLKTIRRRIQRLLLNDYVFEAKTFQFSDRLIDIYNPLYRGATGAFLNPVELLSEFLLTIEDEDLVLEPRDPVLNSKTNIYEITRYDQSPQFHKICKVVRELHGRECKVIVMGSNYDAMPVDGHGKRTIKPDKHIIKNAGPGLLMKRKNVLTVSFGPLLLNTDAELLSMMKDKVFTKGRRTAALRFMKRYFIGLTHLLQTYYKS